MMSKDLRSPPIHQSFRDICCAAVSYASPHHSVGKARTAYCSC